MNAHDRLGCSLKPKTWGVGIKHIIQHLRGSLSLDWTIVGHMIFNRWYIARSCIFGYMHRAFLVICRLRTSLLHVRVSLRVSDAKAICM